MSSLASTTSPERLLQHTQQGTALGVSDGLFYPVTRTGACTWIISTPYGEGWIQGGSLIPGEVED